MDSAERAARIGAVVGGVVRQAVTDAGARGVVLLDDGSAEAALAGRWLIDALGPDAVLALAPPGPAVVRGTLERLGDAGAGADPGVAAAEMHRLAARIAAAERDALLAHPANKTTLLLSRSLPPEALLPLGDLYASRVEALAGGWTAPAAVRALAERAGGIGALDAALARLVDERRDEAAALAPLGDAAEAVRAAWSAGRFARRRVGLVPKLGARTPGIDLWG